MNRSVECRCQSCQESNFLQCVVTCYPSSFDKWCDHQQGIEDSFKVTLDLKTPENRPNPEFKVPTKSKQSKSPIENITNGTENCMENNHKSGIEVQQDGMQHSQNFPKWPKWWYNFRPAELLELIIVTLFSAVITNELRYGKKLGYQFTANAFIQGLKNL